MTERISRLRQIAADRDANLAKHKGGIAGMQDASLEVGPNQVDEIIERTELAQTNFRGVLYTADTSFTDAEIKKARQAIDDVLFPKSQSK